MRTYPFYISLFLLPTLLACGGGKGTYSDGAKTEIQQEVKEPDQLADNPQPAITTAVDQEKQNQRIQDQGDDQVHDSPGYTRPGPTSSILDLPEGVIGEIDPELLLADISYSVKTGNFEVARQLETLGGANDEYLAYLDELSEKSEVTFGEEQKLAELYDLVVAEQYRYHTVVADQIELAQQNYFLVAENLALAGLMSQEERFLWTFNGWIETLIDAGDLPVIWIDITLLAINDLNVEKNKALSKMTSNQAQLEHIANNEFGEALEYPGFLRVAPMSLLPEEQLTLIAIDRSQKISGLESQRAAILHKIARLEWELSELQEPEPAEEIALQLRIANGYQSLEDLNVQLFATGSLIASKVISAADQISSSLANLALAEDSLILSVQIYRNSQALFENNEIELFELIEFAQDVFKNYRHVATFSARYRQAVSHLDRLLYEEHFLIALELPEFL